MNYGELVSVSCPISGGDLPVKMSWHFNGDPVRDNPDLQDVILEMRGQRIYNLVIESVSAKHIGNYSCTTNNIAGRTDFTAELFVNGLSNDFTKFIILLIFIYPCHMYVYLLKIILLVCCGSYFIRDV